MQAGRRQDTVRNDAMAAKMPSSGRLGEDTTRQGQAQADLGRTRLGKAKPAARRYPKLARATFRAITIVRVKTHQHCLHNHDPNPTPKTHLHGAHTESPCTVWFTMARSLHKGTVTRRCNRAMQQRRKTRGLG